MRRYSDTQTVVLSVALAVLLSMMGSVATVSQSFNGNILCTVWRNFSWCKSPPSAPTPKTPTTLKPAAPVIEDKPQPIEQEPLPIAPSPSPIEPDISPTKSDEEDIETYPVHLFKLAPDVQPGFTYKEKASQEFRARSFDHLNLTFDAPHGLVIADPALSNAAYFQSSAFRTTYGTFSGQPYGLDPSQSWKSPEKFTIEWYAVVVRKDAPFTHQKSQTSDTYCDSAETQVRRWHEETGMPAVDEKAMNSSLEEVQKDVVQNVTEVETPSGKACTYVAHYPCSYTASNTGIDSNQIFECSLRLPWEEQPEIFHQIEGHHSAVWVLEDLDGLNYDSSVILTLNLSNKNSFYDIPSPDEWNAKAKEIFKKVVESVRIEGIAKPEDTRQEENQQEELNQEETE